MNLLTKSTPIHRHHHMIQDLNRTLSKHFSISFIFQMTCMLTIWCPRSNCRPQQWPQLEQHLPLHHFKTRIKSAPVYISVVVLLQAQRSSLHSCSGDSELAFINLDGWCVQYWYNSINSNCKFWCGGTMMISLWEIKGWKINLIFFLTKWFRFYSLWLYATLLQTTFFHFGSLTLIL